MDPRRVLGLTPAATKTEVRSAYNRLHRRVHPDAGGTAGLANVVTAAYRATLDGGRSARDSDVDPYAVLGVRPGTPALEVRGAFRRLARLVHPDRGGTDELFRIVDMSYDLVTDPLARAERRTGVRYRPPPPPPPPGPFHPRPPEARRYEPAWRSWAAIGGALGALILGAVVMASFFVAISGVMGSSLVPFVVLVTCVAVMVSRPAFSAIARGATRLRARHAFAAAAQLDDFLVERCLDAPVGRERDDVLYVAYRRWCAVRRCHPVSQLAFVEYLRSVGILYVTASSWDAGVLVGIRLRDDE